MDSFALLLLRISEGLKAADVESLKFLCSQHIGKKKLEKVNSGIELFQYLREMQKLEEDNTEYLRSLLNNIKRADLLVLLEEFERRTPGPQEDLPEAKEQKNLDTAAAVIVEQMGKDWRMYGRKLGMSDAKLDHIREMHPYNLREQVVQLVTDWRKMRGAKANVRELIEALRKCNLNYTADRVQQELLQTEKTQ